MQLVLFIVGKSAHGNEWIACAMNGNKWLFFSIWATLFGILQTMVVMIQTTMCNKLFFKIPKQMGFFDDVKKIKLLRRQTRMSMGI